MEPELTPSGALYDKFTFVLVRPAIAGNIGAAARALKNMGFHRLRLVAPPEFDRKAAATMAVHAADVVHEARIYDDLLSSVGDHTLTVGTTCRKGSYRRHARELREVTIELVKAAQANRIAIIFGPEANGLSNDDLELCQELIVIPTSPAYPSLNLAQAVAIVAYELRMALREAIGAEKANANAEPHNTLFARAPVEAVEMMIRRLEEVLLEIGFLSPDNPQRIMLALRALFGRAGLSQRELDILNGIVSQVRWFAKGGYEKIAQKRAMGLKIR